LKKLSIEDQNVFEAHLLECERCFEDLTALDRTAHLLRDYLDAPPADIPFAPDLIRKRNRRWAISAAALVLLAIGAWFLRGVLDPPTPNEPGTTTSAALSADLQGLPREMQALLFTARTLMLGEQPDEARRLLTVAEGSIASPTESLLRLLQERARLEYQVGSPENALAALNRAITLAEGVQNFHQVALSRVLLAQLQFSRFLDAAAGQEAFEAATSAAEKDGSRETAYLILKADCRRALLVTGDYTAALGIAEGAIQVWPTREPPPDAILLHASVYEAMAVGGNDPNVNLSEARRLVQEALRRARALEDVRSIAQALTAEGRILMLTGDLEEARSRFVRALDTFGELDLSTGAWNARANLALCYLRKNRLADAERTLRPVRTAATRTGNPFLRFDATRLDGWLKLESGKEKQALVAFREAEKLGKRLYQTWIRQMELTRLKRVIETPKAPPTLPRAVGTGLY
jgi:tetratricopeptide (TPR) repeat protein